MIKKETASNCYYYNWNNNPNFEYVCPTVYGARCEFYDKFFSAKNQNGEDLDPDCTLCELNELEKEVGKN